MPHSFGYRARTRDMFSRDFRKAGATPALNEYFKQLRVGQIVDIKANSAIHKGMPHKFYHGRTGIVFNVTPRAVGVLVNKQVRNRILQKRIHVRVEHVRISKCREDFLKRVKGNDALKRDAKAKGEKVDITQIKRFPKGPSDGFFVDAASAHGNPVVLKPAKFDEML